MKRTLYCLLLLLLAATAVPAAAQGNDWVLVPIRTIAVEQPDGVDVEVYFSLRDLQGRVVTRQAAALDQTGNVQMRTGPAGTPQPAAISDPNTPISIILLIDSSGSMAPAMAGVIAAAQKAVDQAPANSVFSVFNFNNVQLDQPFEPMIAQSSDREQVKQVIGSIAALRNGITCMYNAAYKVLEHPRVQLSASLPRSALIIFTDGKDDNGQGGRCSTISEQGLVEQSRKYLTQVHTIGLCTDAACSNVDRGGLEMLARDAAGFSAFGEINAISNSFAAIMEAINSQFVARFRVLAAQGENIGRLDVTTRNQALPIAGDFVFTSSRTYFLNPVFSLTRRYDSAANTYQIGVVIDNPQTVGRVTISVVDSQAGTIIGDELVLDVPPGASGRTELTTALQADALVSGTEYCFQLRAVTTDGTQIVTPAQLGSAVQSVITEQCGQHRQTIRFDIAEVTPNYETGRLLVRLAVSGMSADRANVSGEILDGAEVQIARIDAQLPAADGTLNLALPAALLRQGAAEFTLRLTLVGGDEPLVAVRKFRHQPPEQDLPIAPIIAVSAALLMFVIGILYARRRPAASTILPAPQPVRDGSGAAGGLPLSRFDQPVVPPAIPARPPTAPQAQPQAPEVTRLYAPHQESLGAPAAAALQIQRARIRFLRSPAGQQQPERIVTAFPTRIGRAGAIIVAGDTQVSREHAELSLLNGVLYLRDLNSTHGTRVDGSPLSAAVPLPITAPVRVMLGPQTELEISPLKD
jgi:hypothetical protein